MSSGRDADFSTTMRGRVEAWLRDEGWSVEARENPDARWMLMAVHPVTHVLMVVVQRLSSRDQIILSTGWRFSAELQQDVAALPQEGRHQLIYDLHSPLLLLGVEYEGVREPFRHMAFSVPLYFDGLTKDLFMARTITIRNALHVAQNVVARSLRQPPPR